MIQQNRFDIIVDDRGSDTASPNDWEGLLEGPSLYLAAAGLGISLFLSGLEATIVSTSLIAIATDLGEYGRSNWVITSYLLTYTGFLMLWSKSGAIWGVKRSLLASLLLFTSFSGGCGAVKSLNQLIICRTLQGTGAAGVYTLALFTFIRLVPYKKYDTISCAAAGILTLGLMLGPLIGGALADAGSWRWVFLLNVPAGALAAISLVISLPTKFPHRVSSSAYGSTDVGPYSTLGVFIQQVDIFGALAILAASAFVVAALQEGNFQYQWTSGLVISFLVLSGILFLFFIAWEWLLSRRAVRIDPMFPWRLARNRVFMGAAWGCFTTGLPMTVCIVEIPQRFQVVDQNSPFEAGVKLLAFALSCPVGVVACSIAAGRLKVPFCYIILASLVFQVTGVFLFSEIKLTVNLWPGQFGYLILIGIGVGAAVTAFYMMVPLIVDAKDQSIATGACLQLRTLGGVLGIAVCVTILHNGLQEKLLGILSGEEVETLLDSSQFIETFPADIKSEIRQAYAITYNAQMKLVGGFCLAQLLGVALIWKRPHVRYLKN